MNLFTDLFLLERLDQLIRTKATGTPEVLASRLEICVRNVFRLITQLREMGFPVEYDKAKGHYYYSEHVELVFFFKVGGKSLFKIQCQENNF